MSEKLEVVMIDYRQHIQSNKTIEALAHIANVSSMIASSENPMPGKEDGMLQYSAEQLRISIMRMQTALAEYYKIKGVE